MTELMHCDHECVCPRYELHNAPGYPCTHNEPPMGSVVTAPCKHDTRAPSGPMTQQAPMEEYGCDTCLKFIKENCTDNIARTEVYGKGITIKRTGCPCHSFHSRPAQQAPAPTNHLAIPCPKCGKWIFWANVDEGYTLFCSDDECGWKQKIVVQQAPAVTADNIIEITKAQLDDDIIREAIHLSIHQRENFSQSEHDAALIQERGKWERERAECPYKFCIELSCIFYKPNISAGNKCSKGCIIYHQSEWDLSVAAQARKDVLKEIIGFRTGLSSRCLSQGKQWDAETNYLKSLRSEVKK